MLASEDQGPVVEITISCTPGVGASVHPVSGTGQYAAGGYMTEGYQYFDGAMIVSDVIGLNLRHAARSAAGNYRRRSRLPARSGASEVVSEATITGNDAGQQAAALAQAYFGAAQQQAASGGNAYQQLAQDTIIAMAAQATAFAQALARTPTFYQLVLKPVVNGPFSAEYDIPVSSLALPLQIDLTANSSPFKNTVGIDGDFA